MSVINDMLRDLETRKAPDRESSMGSVTRNIVEPAASQHHWYSILPWLLLVLLLVAALVYVLLLKQTVSEAPFQTSVSPENAATAQEPQQKIAERMSEPPQLVSVRDAETVSTVAITRKPQPDAKGSPGPEMEGMSAAESATETKKVIDATVVNRSVEPAPPQQTRMEDASPLVAEQVSKVSNPVLAERREAVIAKPEGVNTLPVESQVAQAVTTISESDADTENQNDNVTTNARMTLSPQAQDLATARKAREMFDAGRDAAAFRLLYDFLANSEQDEQSRAVLASNLMQVGRFAEAGDLLLDAEAIENPDLRQIKARWYMQQGNKELALHTLREKVPDLASYPDYFALMALYYQQMGYPQQAALLYSQLLEFNREAADWWAGLAISLDQQGRFDEAREAYAQALQLPGLAGQLIALAEQRLAVFNQ